MPGHERGTNPAVPLNGNAATSLTVDSCRPELVGCINSLPPAVIELKLPGAEKQRIAISIAEPTTLRR